MSIVEKAISKLQAQRERAAPAPVAVVTPSAAVGAPRMPAPQSLRERPNAGMRERPAAGPRESVHIDIAKLRAAGLLPPEHAAARVTDEFRRIKWPLLATAFGRETQPVERGNLIMVASCVPDEGKTFTAVNLAMTIALERDCTVLLVDGDVAKPNISRVLGIEGRVGAIDAVASDIINAEDAVLETSVAGLCVLPAGQRNVRAPELYASQRMDQVAAELAAYDPNRVVIFDSSPILATNEAPLLARVVGQILVVVRANRTLQPLVREALALLDPAKSISLMLNQTDAGFGEYYGGYYGYEKDE